jgi:hypothetical protein
VKAVVTCTENGIRFFLAENRHATDIVDRAHGFRDGTDAALAAGQERKDSRAWQTQKWEPAFLLANGTA